MNRLKLLRYERGLTRREVSTGSGVPVRTLTDLEKRGHQPGAPTAKALADFYKVPVTHVLGIESGDEEAA